MASASNTDFKLYRPSGGDVQSGSVVILPCYLHPERSAVEMTVRWFRGTECICLYKDGRMTVGRGYEGRISLFSQELEKGNVSLIIRDYSWTGDDYLCQVSNKETTAEFTVGLDDPTEGLGAYILQDRDRKWTEDERKKMEESALIIELSADATQSLEMKNKKLEKEKTLIMEEKSRLQQELGETQQQLQEKDTAVKNMETELEHSKKQLERIEEELKKKNRKLQEMECMLPPAVPQSGSVELDPQDVIPARPRRRHSKEGIPPGMREALLELRLVLLGRTEHGEDMKSSIGAAIFGEKRRSQDREPIVREQSDVRRGVVSGRQVTVVDTLDWFSPGLSQEALRNDVGVCINLSSPGPHAFLLVVPVRQVEEESTGEEVGMLERMGEIFGERCWRNTMVLVVTEEDQVEDVDEFVRSGNEEVRRLVEKCEERYHCLHLGDGGVDESEICELLKKVEEMVGGHRDKFYSSEVYLEAEAHIREIEERVVREREEIREKQEREAEEKRQRNVRKSEVQFRESTAQFREQINQHEVRITTLETMVKEERDEKRKLELENHLEREVQQRNKLQVELQRLKEQTERDRRAMEERHQQEMEEIREVYEGEARMKAERVLRKNILPELKLRTLELVAEKQKDLDIRLKEKDRELERLRIRLQEMTPAQRDEPQIDTQQPGLFSCFWKILSDPVLNTQSDQ
ncbi:golgin subfamily A member 4-like [Astyanax mexicanus]|uniref:Golgin subfamily A member 4-like n=1 Tax=Astyanax mexicanus TaxID=7994 RepID=A0A8T2KVT6_ASTMX|nr:golgin subfamily A member 4-like [Astyanax mexicanus]